MRQTLFHIPHALGPLPLFGLGWAMMIWTVVAIVILLRAFKAGGQKGLWEQLPFLLIVTLIIGVVLPFVEERNSADEPIGLPIRGYGVMLLLGVVSGMATAAYRVRQLNFNEATFFSLAFWMFLFGILGARLFYLAQYWDTFQKPTLRETLISIINFTEGGLVVYGSLIGGLLAGLIFVRVNRLPLLALADVVAPSLVLGLAFGRIGCLLNGCCHGGVCDRELPAIRFPAGSAPYMQQLHDGDLLGVELHEQQKTARKKQIVVQSVEANGAAAKKGVEPGAVVELMPNPRRLQQYRDARATKPIVRLRNDSGEPVNWTVDELPDESLPVYPAQIYASINAFLLFLLTWFLFPQRRRDGVVFATLMTLYPISRILEELIRADETGQWGTSLTISQWISVGILVFVSGLWLHIVARGQPATTSFEQT